MGTEGLKQALDDCVINFDRRVLLTDLLQEYELPYAEVDKVLSAHIAKEEKKGAKFEKRFLVSGEEQDTTNEVYTVVQGETKLREWLRKLKNAESSLYSVEIDGGAKSAADIFQPMKWCENQIKIDIREPLTWGASNGTTNGSVKTVIKKEENKPKGLNFAPKKPEAVPPKPNVSVSDKGSKKVSPPAKKASPGSKQNTPEEQKTPAQKTNNKKGIASFFGAAGSTTKSESKKASEVIKPPTPKKMQDFFKKSDKAGGEKSVKEEERTDRSNTSVQLFSTEDDERDTEEEPHDVVDVDTSDDEAELEKIRKECAKIDDEESGTNISKRRRIIDSDDEEPQVKHDKKDEDVKDTADSEETEGTGMSESYLDEDGFVVTIKTKKSVITKKPMKLEKSPEKSPPKQEASKKPTKPTPKATSKTKQGNIMSFFNKK